MQIANLLDIPASVNTLERLCAWVGTLAAREAGGELVTWKDKPRRAFQVVQTWAADGSCYLVIRASVPLPADWATDKSKKLWGRALETVQNTPKPTYWFTDSYIPQPWTPALITTQLWLDAFDSNGVTLTGGAVSQWADKSGNNRDFTQSSAAVRPLYYSVAGGETYPFVQFDGSTSNGDFLTSSSFSGVEGSLFIVLTSQAGAALVGLFNGGGYNVHANTSSPFGWAASSLGTRYRASEQLPSNTRTFIEFRGRSSGTLRRAATQKGNHSGMNDNGNTPKLGCEYSTSSTTRFPGKIHELIITGTLTAAQYELMEGYLAKRWDLRGQLPTNHPYKTADPVV
jgi:hypothetical protein